MSVLPGERRLLLYGIELDLVSKSRPDKHMPHFSVIMIMVCVHDRHLNMMGSIIIFSTWFSRWIFRKFGVTVQNGSKVHWRMWPGKGVLRFGLDRGVLLEPQNPYPFLRVIFAKGVPISKDFSWNIGQFFIFCRWTPPKHPKFWTSWKNRPMSKGFYSEKQTHV